MDYFLKFKSFDNYSFDDLSNQMASFGLYRIFKDQKELIACINSHYLNKKYSDNSLTDYNAVKLMRDHILDKYLLFSMACFEPMTEDRMRMFWYNYTNNNGFAILYSVNDIIDFISKNNSDGSFRLMPVFYTDKKFDLTGYFDCFLSSINPLTGGFVFKDFYRKLHETRHKDDEIMFMCTKTCYKYKEEKEYRIIKKTSDRTIISNDHCLIPFIKPLKVFILKGRDNGMINKTISICKELKIQYETVNNAQKLVYNPKSIINSSSL